VPFEDAPKMTQQLRGVILKPLVLAQGHYSGLPTISQLASMPRRSSGAQYSSFQEQGGPSILIENPASPVIAAINDFLRSAGLRETAIGFVTLSDRRREREVLSAPKSNWDCSGGWR